jgi:hypothetical protein
MPRITPTQAYRVDIIESGHGWGQKIDETIYFDNEPEAQEYVRKYNSQNTAKEVPDWYMYAEYVGSVR